MDLAPAEELDIASQPSATERRSFGPNETHTVTTDQLERLLGWLTD